MNYFYVCEGKPKGPVSENMLLQFHADGIVDDTTLVVAEGESTWVPFSARIVKPVEDLSTRDKAKPKKEPISAAVVHIANSAVSEKGEFDVLEKISFPKKTIKGKFLDTTAPNSWTFFYRLHCSGKIFPTQLYVIANNYSIQGIVRYNTAKVTGGDELQIKNINVFSDENYWQEHLTISISAKTLALAGYSPLRIQVSRPDKGLSFVIEVPVDFSLAVAYRLNPDHFEIMEEPPAAKNKTLLNRKQLSLNTAEETGNLAFYIIVLTLASLLVFALFAIF